MLRKIATELRAIGYSGERSIRVYARALRLLWQAAPLICSVMAVLLLVQGGVPPALLHTQH